MGNLGFLSTRVSNILKRSWILSLNVLVFGDLFMCVNEPGFRNWLGKISGGKQNKTKKNLWFSQTKAMVDGDWSYYSETDMNSFSFYHLIGVRTCKCFLGETSLQLEYLCQIKHKGMVPSGIILTTGCLLRSKVLYINYCQVKVCTTACLFISYFKSIILQTSSAYSRACLLHFVMHNKNRQIRVSWFPGRGNGKCQKLKVSEIQFLGKSVRKRQHQKVSEFSDGTIKFGHSFNTI